MRVILTRQPAQAGQIEAGLEQLGYRIGFLPLTDFQLPGDLVQLDEMVSGLHEGAWDRVLFTSPNTIRALVARGWEPANTELHTNIAVTGPGTARVLYYYGATITPWMPTDDASADGILNQFPSGPGRLALPQGKAAGAAMTQGLTERGWDVTHVVAYHTVDYPAAADRALLPAQNGVLTPANLTADDVVVLTAPSAARRWAETVGNVAALIAIGQPTRRAAEHHHIALAATAPSPDAHGIAQVLKRL
ncbi:uroporphyrinogen-III synthase/uroporphyrinogen III methyltransferase/synthase [Enteractinococcus coprophilus]|uniref:Uroporphyrinogen-III synthase n=1 Tax=Enteractinococcus coprophilus TaxID=1027633 RepID=A0A543A0C8_9MICC|nr:uroporphyrinogen-III synthase/uroporphyrinogen III methyltransferase/synthase [Enteractinococcus coprophilus]